MVEQQEQDGVVTAPPANVTQGSPRSDQRVARFFAQQRAAEGTHAGRFRLHLVSLGAEWMTEKRLASLPPHILTIIASGWKAIFVKLGRAIMARMAEQRRDDLAETTSAA